MTENMLTAAGILQYAIRIEKESRRFYEDALAGTVAPDIRSLLEGLRDDEIDHARRLADRLRRIGGQDDPFDAAEVHERMLVETPAVPDVATETDVLNVALKRERNTRDFYRTVMTLTNLTDDLISQFEDLFEQESGHVIKIENRLQKAG